MTSNMRIIRALFAPSAELNTYDKMVVIATEPDNHPDSYIERETAPSIATGESFGHPYCPPSSGFSDEFESHIVNVAHTVERLDSTQWELYVLEVLTHPEYQTGATLDKVFSLYKENPNTWNYALMQGVMAAHQYECYA